ncbi:MAG: hypothetical protein V4509_02690, partial [Patescibacteria group bacterium]
MAPFFSNLKKVHKKIIIFTSLIFIITLLGLSSTVYADYFTWTPVSSVSADNHTYADAFISEDGTKILIAKNSNDNVA